MQRVVKPQPIHPASGDTDARATASPLPRRSSLTRWLRLAALALVLAAPLFTLAFIARFGINAAEWDHLVAAELFNRWHDGMLTPNFLFAQHNEHRPVVPRLVVLGFGRLTRFNNVAEMYLQWALIVCTAFLIARAFTKETSTAWDPVKAVPIVLLLFSIRQYEILLSGEGLLTYLSLVFFVAALYCLTARPATRLSLALAVTCAVLASFSQSNALLIWPIGVAALAFELRTEAPRYGWSSLVVWTVAATAVLGTYFYGYEDLGNHPPASFVVHYPKVALSHFLAVGGTALGGELWSSVAMGIAMTLVETVVVIAVVRECWRRRESLPLGIWLIACAVASQAMITLNRAGFGLEQALASRYSTYLALASIGVYWCTQKYRVRWQLAGDRLATVVVTLILVGWLSASINGWFGGKEASAVHQWRGYVLYTAKYQAASTLREVYPNPEHARLYAAGLERLGLSIFADEHIDPGKLVQTTERPPFFLDWVNGQAGATLKTLEVSDDQPIVLDGRALDRPGVRAAAVFVTIDGALDIPAMMAEERPDLLALFRSPPRSGAFRASFSAAVLQPGIHHVSLKIVAADRVHAFVSEPLLDLVKR